MVGLTPPPFNGPVPPGWAKSPEEFNKLSPKGQDYVDRMKTPDFQAHIRSGFLQDATQVFTTQYMLDAFKSVNQGGADVNNDGMLNFDELTRFSNSPRTGVERLDVAKEIAGTLALAVNDWTRPGNDGVTAVDVQRIAALDGRSDGIHIREIFSFWQPQEVPDPNGSISGATKFAGYKPLGVIGPTNQPDPNVVIQGPADAPGNNPGQPPLTQPLPPPFGLQLIQQFFSFLSQLLQLFSAFRGQ